MQISIDPNIIAAILVILGIGGLLLLALYRLAPPPPPGSKQRWTWVNFDDQNVQLIVTREIARKIYRQVLRHERK